VAAVESAISNRVGPRRSLGIGYAIEILLRRFVDWFGELGGSQRCRSVQISGGHAGVRLQLMLPLLTLAADACGILAGWISRALTEPIALRHFLYSGLKDVNDKTVYQQAAAGATALNEDAEALKYNFLPRGFFKKRGHEDAEDLTKHQIARLPAGTPQKTFDYDGRAIFDQPDTAKRKDKKALADAGAYLQSNKFGLAVVVASVGMKGETDKDRVAHAAESLHRLPRAPSFVKARPACSQREAQLRRSAPQLQQWESSVMYAFCRAMRGSVRCRELFVWSCK